MFELEDGDFAQGQDLAFCYYYGFYWRVEPEIDEREDEDDGIDV